MQKINNQNIKTLEILLENNEKIIFGEKSVKEFEFNEINDLKLHLKLGIDILYKPLNYQNPLDRLYCKRDIVEVKCILKDKKVISIIPKWKEGDNPYIMNMENDYQISTRDSLSEIHIEITNKANNINKPKILSLSEIREDGIYKDIENGEILVINKGRFDTMTIDMIKHTFEKIA